MGYARLALAQSTACSSGRTPNLGGYRSALLEGIAFSQQPPSPEAQYSNIEDEFGFEGGSIVSRQAFINGFAVGICCVGLWGCGGSSNDDDSAPVSGVSVGTITGFGSVVVNGWWFSGRAS